MMTKAPPVHFLLVDDLPENLLSLEALLRRENLVLLKARSGPEALELLLQHEFALALIDVQMPEMNGFELAETMRGSSRTQRVPIIFLTAGEHDRQRRFRGYEAGAVDFLYKPVEPDVLRSKADVFFNLYRQQQELALQRDKLQEYAEALQRADRRKDEFLATMSHEIRTPMNAIIGLADILARTTMDARQQQYVGTLRTSAGSLLGLINDLLDTSKIQAESMELAHVPFKLATVIGDVASIICVKAEEKGLSLEVDIEGQLEDVYCGDPERLRQLLLNLGSNAVKFTERGKVTVYVASTPAANGHDTITITVRDTGIGIPPEKLETIFEKFVQADNSISRKYGGTGLGLTIARQLAGLMGGDITVASTPEIETVFTVTLSLERANSGNTEAVPSATAKAPANHPRVLLVEDQPANVLVARTYLEDFGYEVEVATDGQQAVARCASQYYKVVLMDVQMPGMNGFEATQAIRAREQQENRHRMPIMGMTAHASREDRQRCLEAGMDDYITKPFEPDEFQHKLALLAGSA